MATTWLNDTFSTGADTVLSSHSPETGSAWARHPTYSTVTITDLAAEGRITGSSSTASSLYVNGAAPPSADYCVTAVCRCTATGSAGRFGIGARYNNASPEAGYLFNYDGTGWYLSKLVAGVSTGLGSLTFTPTVNTDYTLKLECFSDKISAWVNGALIFSVTDASVSSAGGAAVFLRSSGRIDSITAATLDATPSQLSQTVAEVVTAPTPKPTLSQVVAEVVTSPNPNLQVYQQVAETVWAPVPSLQLHQQVVEVIRANGAETPIVPDLNQQPLTIICC